MELEGKNVRIELNNTYRYAGPVLEENDTFLIILDKKTNRTYCFNKNAINTIEVIE